MNMNKFLELMSDKGISIIIDYVLLFSKKSSFTVTPSNESYVEFNDPENYCIYINTTELTKECEYVFLHEFFHCIQYEEGFPGIKPTSNEYKEFATEFGSSILDFNVRSRLESYGYFNHVEQLNHGYQILIDIYNSLFKLKEDEDISYFENIQRATLLVTLYQGKIHNNDISKLLRLIRTVNPQTYEIYKLINKCFRMYNYDSKSGVYKIFKKLISELKLEKYISMTN